MPLLIIQLQKFEGDEMKFKISAENSRHDAELYELDILYDENIIGTERYSFDGDVYLHVSDDSEEKIEQIGLIRTTFLDEEMISNECSGSLAENADAIDEDISKAFRFLEQSSVFAQPHKPSRSMLPLHSCYISTFMINTEYRNQGLGTHLVNNLSRIYHHLFNVYVNCVIVYPKPFVPKECRDEKIQSQAKEQMIKFFEKNGFVALGDSGFYARNYISEAYI